MRLAVVFGKRTVWVISFDDKNVKRRKPSRAELRMRAGAEEARHYKINNSFLSSRSRFNLIEHLLCRQITGYQRGQYGAGPTNVMEVDLDACSDPQRLMSNLDGFLFPGSKSALRAEGFLSETCFLDNRGETA